jgi:uncharacterized protein YjbJ (UPF0337 family)
VAHVKDKALDSSPSVGRHQKQESHIVNWDSIEGGWKQMTGKVKEQWGKLTDDDLAEIGGKRDQLAGMIQARYGIAKEEAEKQLSTFERNWKN